MGKIVDAGANFDKQPAFTFKKTPFRLWCLLLCAISRKWIAILQCEVPIQMDYKYHFNDVNLVFGIFPLETHILTIPMMMKKPKWKDDINPQTGHSTILV